MASRARKLSTRKKKVFLTSPFPIAEITILLNTDMFYTSDLNLIPKRNPIYFTPGDVLYKDLYEKEVHKMLVSGKLSDSMIWLYDTEEHSMCMEINLTLYPS